MKTRNYTPITTDHNKEWQLVCTLSKNFDYANEWVLPVMDALGMPRDFEKLCKFAEAENLNDAFLDVLTVEEITKSDTPYLPTVHRAATAAAKERMKKALAEAFTHHPDIKALNERYAAGVAHFQRLMGDPTLDISDDKSQKQVRLGLEYPADCKLGGEVREKVAELRLDIENRRTNWETRYIREESDAINIIGQKWKLECCKGPRPIVCSKEFIKLDQFEQGGELELDMQKVAELCAVIPTTAAEQKTVDVAKDIADKVNKYFGGKFSRLRLILTEDEEGLHLSPQLRQETLHFLSNS